MYIDDDEIFKEYYEIKRVTAIPLLYFIKHKHIKMAPRKFYLKYRKWLLAQGLTDIYHTTEDYLTWILDLYKCSDIEIERCKYYHNKISNINIPHSEMIVATAIFYYIINPDKEELCANIQISTSALDSCLSHINPILTDIQKSSLYRGENDVQSKT